MSTQPVGDRINVDALLASVDIAEVVGRYVELKRAGRELKGLCPFHGERTPSFHVVPHKQAAFCNGCGWHGDAIDFVQKVESVDFREACSRLGARDSVAPPVERKPRPAAPPERITRKPPEDAPEPRFYSRKFGDPVRLWNYRDADGGLLGYVARYEYTDDDRKKKLTPQWTWGSTDAGHTWAWGMGHWNKPRPLYGLDRLAARPDAEVLITEGEKACDASALLKAYVNVTWPGGTQAVPHVDWTPLRGRRVILWPDADTQPFKETHDWVRDGRAKVGDIMPTELQPGWLAMQEVAKILAGIGCTIRIIDPRGQVDGWDCADAIAEGWTAQRIALWAKERISVWTPQPVADQAPALKEVMQSERTVGNSERPTDRNSAGVDRPAVPSRPAGRPTLSVVDGNTVRAPPPPAPSPDDLPPEYSDDAVAQLFTKRHGDTLRFVSPWGRWLRWTGSRWLQDETLESFDLARAVCRAAAAEAFSDRNLTPAQQRRGAQTLASTRTRNNIESMARADRRHAATTDQWDANQWLLNTPGGVVDLLTGELRPARAEDYQTKITHATPGGPAPRWREFLQVVTDGDVELQEFLQRMAGYSLTGTTREHAMFFMHGGGGNGKGVFLNTFQWLLGDYSRVSPVETFTESKDNRHPTELAALRGARLVTAQETEEGRRWAENRLKALTGGDPITARFMRQDDFTFAPQFKLIVASNNKPAFRNIDEGIRRRLHLIPFTVTIPQDIKDPMLPEKLREEAGGILQWAVDGCMEWQRNGLRPPECVRAATDDYLQSQDVFAGWIDECCTLGEFARAGATELYRSFAAWAEQRGEFIPTQTRFADRLAGRGFEKSKGGRGMIEYKGISLNTGRPQTTRMFVDD